MILKLTNNVTKTEYEFEVEDKGTSNLFFDFDIVLNDGMADGEYTYKLYNEKDEEIATGLAQIGDYKPKKATYDNKRQTIVYNG